MTLFSTIFRAIFATSASLFLFAPVGGHAQLPEIVCPIQYAWVDNAKGQSPCLVASMLGSVCAPFIVSPLLGQGESYAGPGPGGSNDCQCSSVLFSLMSACGFCQNQWVIKWSDWSRFCGRISVGTWPNEIPNTTSIPPWAYLDVTATDVFNVAFAQIESLHNSSGSTSTPRSTIEPSSETFSSTSPSGTSSTGNSKSSITRGVIASGFLGGVLALIVIGVGILYCLKKMSRPTANNMHLGHPALVSKAPIDQIIYDPNNPSTFPTLPEASSRVSPRFSFPTRSTRSVQPSPFAHYGISDV